MHRLAILEGLKQLPHFQNSEPGVLESVADVCHWREFQRGETLFTAGERCRGWFIVRLGSVRLYRISPDGHEQSIHHIAPPQSFAEAALFNFGYYPVHGEACEKDTALIEVGGQGFLELLRGDPTLGQRMLGSLCQRLLTFVERVEELSIVGAEARLARYLVRLPTDDCVQGVIVRLPMAKKELAGHLAMTPETLSRQLHRWRDRGIAEGRGRELVLLDTETLLEIASR